MKTKWILDSSHSEVQFKVKHMVISTVTGYFTEIEASAESNDATFLGGEFTFKAKTNSIDTRNSQRDEHLRSGDFFDSEKFPDITFKGTFDGNEIKGDLVIRDVSKFIVLKTDFGGVITDPYDNQRAGFELEGEINRKDFGLNWNATMEAGGLVVSDKVKLIINLEFTQEQ